MWKILQYKKPDDFVIATGKQYTVKEFVNLACKELAIKINWRGKGLNEVALDESGRKIIKIDKKYFRPTEVDSLRGDSTKAKKILNWTPKTTIKELIIDMISNEI